MTSQILPAINPSVFLCLENDSLPLNLPSFASVCPWGAINTHCGELGLPNRRARLFVFTGAVRRIETLQQPEPPSEEAQCSLGLTPTLDTSARFPAGLIRPTLSLFPRWYPWCHSGMCAAWSPPCALPASPRVPMHTHVLTPTRMGVLVA